MQNPPILVTDTSSGIIYLFSFLYIYLGAISSIDCDTTGTFWYYAKSSSKTVTVYNTGTSSKTVIHTSSYVI